MLVETKYNIGETLFFKTGGLDTTVVSSNVTDIEICINDNRCSIVYVFGDLWGMPRRIEEAVFKKKEDVK